MKLRSGWVLAALAVAACRGDEKPYEVPPHVVAQGGPTGMVVRVLAPDSMGWNREDSVRISVANHTGAPYEETQIEVFFTAPIQVDTAGVLAREQPDGVLLRVPLRTLPSGESSLRVWRFRMPPAPLPDDSLPLRYIIRATLAGGDTVADTVYIRPGSEIVAGGCASPAPPAAQRFGIGPVRVGIPESALRASCPEARDSTWEQEGTKERGLVVRPGGVPVLALVAGDSIARVEVSDPRIRTASGVGVGSTVGDLKARYGRLCGGAGEGVVAVWFQNAPGIGFALDSVTTKEWFRARGPVDALPDSARVERYFIHGLDTRCPGGDR